MKNFGNTVVIANGSKDCHKIVVTAINDSDY